MVDKFLTEVYDKLEEMDHKDDFNLTKGILWQRYSIEVPDDLIDIAYNEIMDDGYYNLSSVPNNDWQSYTKVLRRKMLIQRGTKKQYKLRWYNEMNRIVGWKTFPDYVRSELAKKFKNLDFTSISNFFVDREYISHQPKKLLGFIKHPGNGFPIWGISIHILLKKFHDRARKVEERIERRLNFLPNDECCAKATEMESEPVYPTFKPFTTPSLKPAITTSKPWNQDMDDSWNSETTPDPFSEPITNSWNFATTTPPSNIEGSSDTDYDKDYEGSEHYEEDDNGGIDDGFNDFEEDDMFDDDDFEDDPNMDSDFEEDDYESENEYSDNDFGTDNDFEAEDFGGDDFEDDDFATEDDFEDEDFGGGDDDFDFGDDDFL